MVRLSSILLFSLVTPYIMRYSLSVVGTPYILFGLIFLGMILFISFDLFALKEKIYHVIKGVILWGVIVLVLGSSFSATIIRRHQTAPVFEVHDIILQQEAALQFLIHGKNPYRETYFGTPLEEWHYSDTEVNPALYHFVMQPFYLLFIIPFYVVSNLLFGFFDARIPLYLLFFAVLVICWLVVKDEEKKRQFVILMAFNPAMLGYTLEGRSDVFMYAFLLAGLLLLQKKRIVFSGIFIAVAFAVKQSAWLLFPFYSIYIMLQYHHPFKKKGVHTLLQSFYALLPFIFTFTAITIPFVLWNVKAYYDSTILYLSGNIATGYPISGYGFGQVLHEIKVIKNLHDYYPFQLWQLLICLPLLGVLVRYLSQGPSVKRMIVCYGLFLFVYWYFSRYFNNSHVGYLTMVFITAYFWPDDAKEKI